MHFVSGFFLVLCSEGSRVGGNGLWLTRRLWGLMTARVALLRLPYCSGLFFFVE